VRGLVQRLADDEGVPRSMTMQSDASRPYGMVPSAGRDGDRLLTHRPDSRADTDSPSPGHLRKGRAGPKEDVDIEGGAGLVPRR
jgi:hypothetical protein